MAVPNTNTFSLQDVVNEVSPTTNDLVSCFADAIASKFDSAYEQSKNQLDDFRNYNGFTLFYIRTSGNASTACFVGGTGGSFIDTVYITGSGTPTNGDVIYEDASATILFDGQGSYWSNRGIT
tara:strand:- start:6683 stop:7051 length:369 start_codon:yes stop_codon:yes gene_type:complete